MDHTTGTIFSAAGYEGLATIAYAFAEFDELFPMHEQALRKDWEQMTEQEKADYNARYERIADASDIISRVLGVRRKALIDLADSINNGFTNHALLSSIDSLVNQKVNR